MVIIDLTARSTTMTSGRWDVGARTDRHLSSLQRGAYDGLIRPRAHVNNSVGSHPGRWSLPSRPSERPANCWFVTVMPVGRYWRRVSGGPDESL